MSKEKRFFAQTPPGEDQQSNYFDSLDDARVWIAQNGGGRIKMRGTETNQAAGSELEMPDLDPPLKGWRTIETWPSKVVEKSHMAVSPLNQTFLDVRADTALSGHDLRQFDPVETRGPTLFRAYCQACGRFFEVTQKGVIYSLLGDGRCQGYTWRGVKPTSPYNTNVILTQPTVKVVSSLTIPTSKNVVPINQ